MKIELFKYVISKPLKSLGFTHYFWNVHSDTLFRTWLAMIILFIFVFIARIYMRRKINPISVILEQIIEFFTNLCVESFGYFRYDYFTFIVSLFMFTLFCNFVGLFPFIEEPTSDLNTTFAIAIISFLYVQAQKIYHGVYASALVYG